MKVLIFRFDPQATGRVPAGLLRDHPEAPHLDVQRAGTRAAHLRTAHCRHRRPLRQYGVQDLH